MAEATETKTPRYAVYDKTFLRFVGEVHTDRKEAEKVAKDRGLRKYEIREV